MKDIQVCDSSKLTLAVAQAESVRYNKNANLTKAEEVIASAAAKGAQLVLFPEMFVTGYTVWNALRELAEPIGGPAIQRLGSIARDHRVMVVVGIPELCAGGRIYNSAYVIDADGSVLGTYRKTHLFANESSVFTPGYEINVFTTRLGRIGLMICYDAEFPEVARLLSLKGAQLLLVPTANMDPYSEYQAVYLKSRAMENGVYVACSNTVGDDGTYRYFGQSAVVDPEGRLLGSCGSGEELLLIEIDFGRVPPADGNLRYLEHRRPDLYGFLTQVSITKDE